MPGANSESARPWRLMLDRSLFHGAAWSGLSRWSGQIVSWTILLYAARVLTPQDFGLVAMAMEPALPGS